MDIKMKELGLNEVAVDIKEKFDNLELEAKGTAIMASSAGFLSAVTAGNNALTDEMLMSFGNSTANTMQLAANLTVFGLVAGGIGYGYLKTPKRKTLDKAVTVTEARKTVVEAELVEDKVAFDNLLDQFMSSDFLYVSATSGSGKTVTLNHMFRNHLPEGAKYLVFEGKKEGNQAKKWIGAHTVIDDRTKFTPALQTVVNLMHQRQANSSVNHTMLYVVIDEFTVMDDEGIKLVTKLLTQARSANIKLFLATQAVSASLNKLSGLTELFNAIPCMNLRFNEQGQRVISVGDIRNGKIRAIGKSLLIPQLNADWNENLVTEDDSATWDFGSSVAVASETVETAPKPPQNNATTATTTATDDFMLKYMDVVSDEAGLELDSTFATQIGTAIVKLKRNGEGLSYENIQNMAGMKRNSRQNEDISVVKSYMGVK